VVVRHVRDRGRAGKKQAAANRKRQYAARGLRFGASPDPESIVCIVVIIPMPRHLTIG
jgi:hypothetical protein